MPIKRVTIENYEAFGNLIKKWAKKPKKRPKSLKKLKKQAAKAGVGLVVPKRIKKLRIIDQEEQLLTIVIPIAQMIEESEEALGGGTQYEIPYFYEKLAFRVPPFVDSSNKLKFHGSRIGDYTTSQCL